MSLKRKLSLFAAVMTALLVVPAMALAQEPGGVAANKFDANKWLAAAAGFAIGIAALGGTTGQARAAAAALEGIARNPGAAARIQTPMILGLALIESLVLFALVISVLLWTKIGV
jgi:F-type H+-transporting ATPase subunit c